MILVRSVLAGSKQMEEHMVSEDMEPEYADILWDVSPWNRVQILDR